MADVGHMVRKHTPRINAWQRGFWISVVVCIAVYAVDAVRGDVDASSFWGMMYGTVATVFMAGSALYAVRRRTARYRMGRARSWQQFHIYGGSLFMLLTLMHAAFRVPQGPMTTWLMILSIWVFVSGLLGILVQKWIPRSLASLGVEVLYDRIPALVDELREKAGKIADGLPGPARDYYRGSIEPRMTTPQNRLVYFINAQSGIQTRIREFDLLKGLNSPEDQVSILELKELYITKLELDVHFTLQKALRWWLFTHVPPSLALLTLVVLHIFSVFYY